MLCQPKSLNSFIPVQRELTPSFVSASSFYPVIHPVSYSWDRNYNSIWNAVDDVYGPTEVHPWLQVDLGASYPVAKVVWTDRRDCCQPERTELIEVCYV